MPNDNKRTCPNCSWPIPSGFPVGLCPQCLPVVEGKEIPVNNTALDPAHLPSLEELRRMFPELEILALLGIGGMGVVYKARQPRLKRLVALKVMTNTPGQETDFALRFEREAQVLARLNHPNIVTLFDFGNLGSERTGGAPLFYFLMEFVDGTHLGQLIQSGKWRPAKSLMIVPQICEALQYAHDQGITHRDIKPANILLDHQGNVKIADFGLAKVVGDGEEALLTGLTRTGASMGTPHYMAPEQWDDPAQVDHRADIYALGVVFYEMLTGERPTGVFEPPSRRSKVDKKLDNVVMRTLNQNPERRYQQARHLKDDITRISGSPTDHPSCDVSGKKTRVVMLLLGLGLLSLLGYSGGWMQPAAVPGQWIDLDAQVLEQGDAKATSGGWLLLAKPGPEGGHIVFAGRTALNAGLRGRFHGSDFKDKNAPFLRLRASNQVVRSGGIQLHLDEDNQVDTIWIKQFSARHPDGVDLLKQALADPIPPDREYTLELYLIGSQIIARCNQEIFQVTLSHEVDDSGRTALIEHLGPDRFRDLQFINLDDLPEIEAQERAGWTAPE